MDQLMLGYGVNKPTNGAPPPGYQGDAVLTEAMPAAPMTTYGKKELSLKEKQERAAQMESEVAKNMSSSMSLNNMNKNTNRDLMTDNLMSRNLADMSIKKPVPSSNSNFDLLNQMSPNTVTNTSNNFMMQPSPVINNQFQSQQQRPGFNNNMNFNNTNNSGFNNFSMNNNNRNGNQNGSEFVGIFGNLALPAPPTANNSSMNVQFMNNGSSMMAPQPMGLNVNTGKKPNAMSIPLIPTPPTNSQSGIKKSAMDDLTDIFG
jgi:hypothetical protein